MGNDPLGILTKNGTSKGDPLGILKKKEPTVTPDTNSTAGSEEQQGAGLSGSESGLVQKGRQAGLLRLAP